MDISNIVPFNPTRCHAKISSKGEHRQCKNKFKGEGIIFCGVHLRAKVVKRYDHFYNSITEMNDDHPITLDILKKPSPKLLPKKRKHRFITPISLSVPIRSFPYIEKLQALVRGYHVRNRSTCINKVDFYTQELLEHIPSPYFIALIDDSGKRYGFDLRSLNTMFKTCKDRVNPFTITPFTPAMCFKANKTIAWCVRNKYSLKLEEDPMTEDQKFKSYALTVFQKINLLGNYADEDWILNLNHEGLRKLYISAEDVWNYRTQMPHTEKCKIVLDGAGFKEVSRVKNMPPAEKRELTTMILTEFDRFVSEGINEECKKLGAMLMLTALTEVSPSAAAAMPQYVQQYQDPE